MVCLELVRMEGGALALVQRVFPNPHAALWKALLQFGFK
jgi:hypothetical protein